MRKGGVEPTHPNGHRNLNPARLPIPPLSQAVVLIGFMVGEVKSKPFAYVFVVTVLVVICAKCYANLV